MGGPDTLETQGKRTRTLNGGALRHRRLSKNANIKDRTRRATLQIKIHQQPTIVPALSSPNPGTLTTTQNDPPRRAIRVLLLLRPFISIYGAGG